jgi:hypothetical protein
MEEVIGSGRFLDGKEISLEIEFSYRTIRINILIPKGYSSALTKQIKKEYEKGYVNHPRSFGTMYLIWRKKMGKLGFVGHLPAFYVYAQKYSSFSTKDENDALKGIGRLMLCKALKIGLINETITPESKIFLEADGGDPERFNQQTGQEFKKEDILEDIKDRFPDELKELMSDYSNNLEGLIFWYKMCLTNMNLVKFYESIGFEVIDKKRCTGVPMMGEVGIVLSNVCLK